MLEIFFVVLAIAGVIVASITDLKSRLISNKLSFGLLGIGVIGNTVYSIYSGDTALMVDLAAGLSLMFVAGYLFWKLGGWGAGDAKEFLFLASLVPRYPKFLTAYLNPQLAQYPFPLTMLVNTLLLVFPAVFVYSLSISYRKLNISDFVKPLGNFRRYTRDALFLVSSISLGAALGKPYLSIIAILAFYSAWLKDVYKYPISLVLIILVVNGDAQRLYSVVRYLAATAVFFALLGVFWNSIGILRAQALREARRISDLREGDIIAEEIYIRDGELRRDARSIMEKFKALVLRAEERRVWKQRDVIAYPTAAGLSVEEISALKKYVAEGKLEDMIVVKKNMPFGMVVPLGLFSSLLIGDLLVVLR